MFRITQEHEESLGAAKFERFVHRTTGGICETFGVAPESTLPTIESLAETGYALGFNGVGELRRFINLAFAANVQISDPGIRSNISAQLSDQSQPTPARLQNATRTLLRHGREAT